ncbi:MAG: hypothetical protein II821_06670 [Treponema sp.]|nr:hypothetical protein [Treponema sp.]
MKKIFGAALLFSSLVLLTAQEQSAHFSSRIRAESAKETYDETKRAEKQTETETEQNEFSGSKIEIDGNLTITKINFTGLKKTRKSYMQSRVKKFIGEPLSEENMHDLETALQCEGLFNDIHIQTEKTSDTESEINISVKEKITFIPVPFAMYSNSAFTAGGIVMDTNAFGRKDMFMVGGFFSKNNKSGLAAFSKNPGEHGIPGVALFFMGSKKSPEYNNLSDDTVVKFDALAFNVSISLSEKLSENITFSHGIGLKTSSTEEMSDYKGLCPESIKIGSTSLSLGYSKSDWNGIFMSTNSAAISADFGFSNSDNKDLRYPMGFSFSIGEQHPIIWDRLRMYQKIAGFYGINNHIISYQSQSAGAVTILPGDLSTNRIIGGNAGFEFAIHKFKWGMISVYGDYQAVYVQDFTASNDGDYEFEQGLNGGMRVYLAKIAFPALAMGVAYNATQNRAQFSASIGISY